MIAVIHAITKVLITLIRARKSAGNLLSSCIMCPAPLSNQAAMHLFFSGKWVEDPTWLSFATKLVRSKCEHVSESHPAPLLKSQLSASTKGKLEFCACPQVGVSMSQPDHLFYKLCELGRCLASAVASVMAGAVVAGPYMLLSRHVLCPRVAASLSPPRYLEIHARK